MAGALQPTSPDWTDLGLGVPLLDCTRAREELGWTPTHEKGFSGCAAYLKA